MRLVLSIYSSETLVLRLSQQEGGSARIDEASPRLRTDAERWVSRGLQEWLKDGAYRYPRLTGPDDPEFLPRLHAYVTAQFPLRTVLEKSPTQGLGPFFAASLPGAFAPPSFSLEIRNVRAQERHDRERLFVEAPVAPAQSPSHLTLKVRRPVPGFNANRLLAAS